MLLEKPDVPVILAFKWFLVVTKSLCDTVGNRIYTRRRLRMCHHFSSARSLGAAWSLFKGLKT